MITLIAALYVIVPALLALAAVAYAYACPVDMHAAEASLEDDAAYDSEVAMVFKVQRDSHATKAVAALKLYKQTASKVWYDHAILHWQVANDCHARMVELRC